MRRILVFLTLLIALSAAQAAAEELYLARVVSVDTGQGSLVIELMGVTGADQPGELVVKDKELAETLKSGDVTRLWGVMDASAGELTVTRELSSTGSMKTDPSGVRMRLLKSMRRSGSSKGMGHGKP